MGNVLKMVLVHAIETLWKQGWSSRRITRELGVYRDTVRKYVKRLKGKEAKPAKVTAGKSGPAVALEGVSGQAEDPKPASEVSSSDGIEGRWEEYPFTARRRDRTDATSVSIWHEDEGFCKCSFTASSPPPCPWQSPSFAGSEASNS